MRLSTMADVNTRIGLFFFYPFIVDCVLEIHVGTTHPAVVLFCERLDYLLTHLSRGQDPPAQGLHRFDGNAPHKLRVIPMKVFEVCGSDPDTRVVLALEFGILWHSLNDLATSPLLLKRGRACPIHYLKLTTE